MVAAAPAATAALLKKSLREESEGGSLFTHGYTSEFSCALRDAEAARRLALWKVSRHTRNGHAARLDR